VFPTLYDPFANVCLEALACGLPVVTTTTNGASEIIGEGREGYVIPGEVEGMAEAIAEAVAGYAALAPGRRRQVRLDARRKAEGFTVAANAARVVEVLGEAVRG
jgi:UDP-glucose:(heptosyl)LPS alpha-1,3-glucosyltransferase